MNFGRIAGWTACDGTLSVPGKRICIGGWNQRVTDHGAFYGYADYPRVVRGR